MKFDSLYTALSLSFARVDSCCAAFSSFPVVLDQGHRWLCFSVWLSACEKKHLAASLQFEGVMYVQPLPAHG